jgi:hypothetical protein
MRICTGLAAAGLVLAACSVAGADNILFIEGAEGGHTYSDQASNDLITLGHSVTVVQNPQALNVYQQYDQVWDFRYNTNMTNQDATDMGAYLQGGGRMLVLGENSGFEGSRNVSLRNWLSQVGAGSIGSPVQGCSVDFETTTGPGGIVMNPNPLTGIFDNCATTYLQANITQGFLVSAGPGGDGSSIGWDYGDISGAPNSRLIADWDIEHWQTDFGNGQQHLQLTENYQVFLSRIPAPGAAGLLGVAGLVAVRRRRQG